MCHQYHRRSAQCTPGVHSCSHRQDPEPSTAWRTSLRHGQLPLWFPYGGLGVPLLQSAVSGLFHPATLLLLVTSVTGAMRLSAILAFVLGFVATFALARAIEAPRWAALVAAIAFTCGGAFQGLAMNLVFLQGAGAFPLGVRGLVLALRGTRPRVGIALGAAGLALTCLAGDIETGCVLGLVALGLVIGLRSGRLRALGRSAAIGTLGLVTAAVQLLPTLGLLRHTDRGAGLPLGEATRWSLHPLRLPGIFLGDLAQGVGITNAV